MMRVIPQWNVTFEWRDGHRESITVSDDTVFQVHDRLRGIMEVNGHSTRDAQSCLITRADPPTF